jgi:hypothetical protein
MLNQGVHLAWIANVVIWLAIFVGGAVWRFRSDTGRVNACRLRPRCFCGRPTARDDYYQ